jgi:glycosyltransferase involved in cell wall biosynthesis
VYFDNGAPLELLKTVLSSLERQTYPPTEVVITDDSRITNYEMEIVAYVSGLSLQTRYFRNSRSQGVGGNSNNGIVKTSGDIVHVIHLDDCLHDENSYFHVKQFFSRNLNTQWAFFAGFLGDQIYIPKLNEFICFGQNTFGGPSGLFVRADSKLLYDEALRMYVDTDLVSRLLQERPTGVFLDIPIVNYGVGPWQIQRNTTTSQLIKEMEVLVNKSFVTEKLIQRSRWSIQESSTRRNLSKALYRKGRISLLDHLTRVSFAYIQEKILAIRFYVMGMKK